MWLKLGVLIVTIWAAVSVVAARTALRQAPAVVTEADLVQFRGTWPRARRDSFGYRSVPGARCSFFRMGKWAAELLRLPPEDLRRIDYAVLDECGAGAT
jgi:hypothetical protein